VTQAVENQLAGGALFFGDRAWIDRLDVAFANLYFSAISAATQNGVGAAPRAWRPLLSNRLTAKIARIQFALAGMNAHINRDLVFTLLTMYTADGQAPDNNSVHFLDFTKVNQLLTQVEGEVRATLLVGTPLENGGAFAPLEDIVAMWSVGDARQAAWDHSQAFLEPARCSANSKRLARRLGWTDGTRLEWTPYPCTPVTLIQHFALVHFGHILDDATSRASTRAAFSGPQNLSQPPASSPRGFEF
jgi:hypothetical protein